MDYFYNVLIGFQDNHNIVKALHLLTGKETYRRQTESEKMFELKERLLTNIKLTDIASKTEIINNVVSALRAESTLSYSRNNKNLDIVDIYRTFFINHNVDEDVFMKQYNNLKQIYILQQDGEPLKLEVLEKHYNVISTLLNDARFDLLMSDPDLDDEQKCHLTSWLERYEFVYSNTKWTGILDSKFSKFKNAKRDLQKETQDGFNILFDFKEFRQQTIAVYEMYPTLSGEWENRHILYNDSVNESVIDYMWDYREVIDDEKILPKDDILNSLNDEKHFSEYAFQSLSRYIGNKSIDVSEAQKHSITIWVTNILSNIDRYEINVTLIVRPMVAYDIQVDDSLLLNLIPYSHAQARNINVADLWGKSPLYSTLLTYIDEKIKDKPLLIHKIEEILSSENLYYPELYYCLLEYIVENNIQSCFRYIPNILQKGGIENYRSNFKIEVIYRILKLGDIGKRLLDTQKGTFDIDTLLFYYDTILHKDFSLHDDELTQLQAELENVYPRLEKDQKKDTIKLLLKTGSIDGLCWCIEDLKIGSMVFTGNFPSLDGYNSDQINNVVTIFEIGLSSPDFDYPHDIRESALIALQRFAMESENLRDTITSYLKRTAEQHPKYSYLNRRANNIHDKFFEVNSHVISIKDAANVYCQIAE